MAKMRNPNLSPLFSLLKYKFYGTRDSSVVQRWATGWMIGGSSSSGGWEFFSSPTGAHPASYPMGTGGSFPGGKVARA
jgi:hypothetical protein